MIRPAFPSRPFVLGAEAVALISFIICASMLILGFRLNAYIRDVEIKGATASHAAFMSMLMEPLLRDVAQHGPLPPDIRRQLDEVLEVYISTEDVRTTVIWWPDGTIAYSTDSRLVGLKKKHEHLKAALSGNTIAILEDEPMAHGLLPDIDAAGPILELYVPLSTPGETDIIAVGEFYQDPARLLAQMRTVSFRIWGAIGLTTLLMMGLLFLLVRRARRIVQAQQAELNRQLVETQSLASQNDLLRQAAEQARLDAVEVNEDLLSRLGADLHDGPLQLLGLAVLHHVDSDPGPKAPAQGAARMSAASLTRRAIQELRHLADGLSVPELADLSLAEALQLAVSRHQRQTGSIVTLDLGDLPDDLPDPVKITLYRVVQEGLNNAFRHAGGEGQKVSGRLNSGEIEIRVSDSGPGIGAAAAAPPMTGLGLVGISRRIQTLGGQFDVSAAENGAGTVVTARLPI